MNGRVIVIILLAIAILGGLIYWRQQSEANQTPTVPEAMSTEQNLEEKFNIEIPDDADKTELKDVSGGGASGIFSRKVENERLTGGIIADLPAPSAGEYYEAWVEKGEKDQEGYSVTSIGRLVAGKGGYKLDLNSTSDYTTNDKVIITLEKTADNTPETVVLEGSF